MGPKVETVVFLMTIAWLIRWDYKRGLGSSFGRWVVFSWVLILGSRPVSMWLLGATSAGDDLEGSPFDRLVFLGLIIAGCMVLGRRRIPWGDWVQSNRIWVLFALYLGLSVVWSDYPFVSFKRWIKDMGNVVMVLVVLSDPQPAAAIRTIFARCIFLLIPLSVLFIRCYPDLGRVYNHWTWQPQTVGVTTNKNALGAMILICSLFYLWDVLQQQGPWLRRVREKLVPFMLVGGMVIWLLTVAHSATASFCLVLGAVLVVAFSRSEFIRRKVRGLELYLVALVVLSLLTTFLFDVREELIGGMGRDVTLTGRTEIWRMVLEVPINPWLGTGFYSFWMGDRTDPILEVYKGIKQSHNGYIEVYVNSGLIGVALLAGCIVAAFRTAKMSLLAGNPLGTLRLPVLCVALVHNFTEASFNHLSLIWVAFLLVGIRVPKRRTAESRVVGIPSTRIAMPMSTPQRA